LQVLRVWPDGRLEEREGLPEEEVIGRCTEFSLGFNSNTLFCPRVSRVTLSIEYSMQNSIQKYKKLKAEPGSSYEYMKLYLSRKSLVKQANGMRHPVLRQPFQVSPMFLHPFPYVPSMAMAGGQVKVAGPCPSQSFPISLDSAGQVDEQLGHVQQTSDQKWNQKAATTSSQTVCSADFATLWSFSFRIFHYFIIIESQNNVRRTA
jgi:hypothetical protein